MVCSSEQDVKIVHRIILEKHIIFSTFLYCASSFKDFKRVCALELVESLQYRPIDMWN